MTLLLDWDAEIDGDFRRAFEQALHDLRIGFDDASAIDVPPSAAVAVVIASPTSQCGTPKEALLIVGGPGASKTDATFKLEATDIADTSRRWQGVVDQLAKRLDRRALVPYVAAQGDLAALKSWALEHPADPLAETVRADFDIDHVRARLAAETRRANAAEAKLRDHQRWLNDTKREEGDAVGLKREAEIEAARIQADLDAAHTRIAEQASQLEATAFPPHRLPPQVREIALAARREAGLARVMAEQAEAIALDDPDHLRWPNARYVGETKNRLPNGLGVMTYTRDGRTIGAYRGQFEAGMRAGLGVGDNDGVTWSGRWVNDEAHGLGVADGDDGRRFEGEAIGGDAGARRGKGHVWGEVVRDLRAQAVQKLIPAE